MRAISILVYLMYRDRVQTEQRLIKAVGQIIAEEGYEQVGINRVADRAGVNKILIYRYFGGMNGLMQVYVERINPYSFDLIPTADQLETATVEELFTLSCDYLIAEYRLLRQDVQAQEYLKAKLFNNNVPVNAAFDEKNRRINDAINLIGKRLETPYGPAYASFMHSALNMLTLFSQKNRVHYGMDPSSDDDWKHIETIVRHLFRCTYLYTKEQLDRAGEKSA